MLTEQEDVYYYITVMNENYTHPDLPAGAEDGIIKGMYLFKDGGKPKKNAPHVQLLGSGTILREVIAAAELLEKDFGVSSDIWSCPSFTELRRDGHDAERWNRLHPEDKPRKAYVTQCLDGRAGPAIAATDYVRQHADSIRAFLPDGMRYTVLGTDGFGRSDTRANLRRFFEVDRYYIAQAAIAALAAEGKMHAKDVARAIKEWKIDADRGESDDGVNSCRVPGGRKRRGASDHVRDGFALDSDVTVRYRIATAPALRGRCGVSNCQGAA